METCFGFIGVPPPIKFKSYYVVWKPDPDGSVRSCVGVV